MTHKFLKIINQQGSIQLTDEASAYYFLLMKFKLGLAYINTSANCRCTWSDGTKTGIAYNYCLLNNSNNICVIKNPSDSEVRVAVAPMNFTGDASFNICCTGCEKEVADNLDVYIFAPADNFTPGKSGLQLYSSTGKLIYDSSWRPLKIIKQAQSADAIEENFPISENYGVVLNSGYRKPSDTNYTIGTFFVDSDVRVWNSFPANMGSYTSSNSTALWLAENQIKQDSKSKAYYKTNSIKTFTDSIEYQGFALGKNYVNAQKYAAWSPRDSKTYTQQRNETKQVWVDVEYQEWDDCATTSAVWDSCATKSFEYNSSTGKFEYVCKPGLVQKCQAGFVTKTKKELQTITVTVTDTYIDVYPTLDNPSLMYGMEVYPDGTLFTRTSGLSTIGIVDLTNY